MRDRFRRGWTSGGAHWIAGVTLAGVLAFGAGCVNYVQLERPRKTTLARDRIDLPTSVDPGSDLLFVDVRINGHGPFRLVVDTGATILVLGPRVVAEAGLKPAPGVSIDVIGAEGNSVRTQATILEKVESGDFRIDGLAAALMNKADADNFSRGVTFDGFCGLAAFADVILEMDFPRRQVSVVRAGTERYSAETAVGLDAGQVTLDLGGKPVRVELDSGFDGTFALPLEGAALRYPPITRRDVGSVSLGVMQRGETSSQFDGDLRLGPVTWTNPQVSQGKGLIGARALSTWKVAFDQRGKKIHFLGDELHRQWPARTLRARSAGYTAEFKGSVLRLLRVEPGGPAEAAGLRPGDEILTTNGAGAVEFATGYVPEARAAGPRRLLRVRRDGSEFETTMIVMPTPLPISTAPGSN